MASGGYRNFVGKKAKVPMSRPVQGNRFAAQPMTHVRANQAPCDAMLVIKLPDMVKKAAMYSPENTTVHQDTKSRNRRRSRTPVLGYPNLPSARSIDPRRVESFAASRRGKAS